MFSTYNYNKFLNELKPFVSDCKINVFEIAYLGEEQVSRFKSDFRVVADYFVQIRKNKNYAPSPMQLRHVDEIFRLLAILTGNNKFDFDLNQWFGKRRDISMVDVFKEYENRGEIEGEKEGKLELLIDLIKDGIIVFV